MLFVKALKKVDITDLCTSVSTGPAAGGAADAGGAAEAPADEPKKKEEKVEEATDVNMGGLFGDDDDYWASHAGVKLGVRVFYKHFLKLEYE